MLLWYPPNATPPHTLRRRHRPRCALRELRLPPAVIVPPVSSLFVIERHPGIVLRREVPPRHWGRVAASCPVIIPAPSPPPCCIGRLPGRPPRQYRPPPPSPPPSLRPRERGKKLLVPPVKVGPDVLLLNCDPSRVAVPTTRRDRPGPARALYAVQFCPPRASAIAPAQVRCRRCKSPPQDRPPSLAWRGSRIFAHHRPSPPNTSQYLLRFSYAPCAL